MNPVNKLCHAFSFFLFTKPSIPHFLLYVLSNLIWVLLTFFDITLALNFRLVNLTPCIISLDNQTTLHFWVPKIRQSNKLNLVLIHGYGGNSRWQFYGQVWLLCCHFNVYIPDLLFFGKSYTRNTDRSDVFQATCLGEGLKRLGVDRFSIVGISYGGYVAYRMAEIYSNIVEKVMIVSCGICYTDEQKMEQLRKIGRNALELLLPDNPQDLRSLVKQCLYNYNPTKWVPDFVLVETINVLYKENRKEKLELAEYLLHKKPEANPPVISQETMIVWGDKDNVFPIYLAYQLQRHLGAKAKVTVVKDTGHAVNIDSPMALSHIIKSFVLDFSNSNM